VKRKAVLAVAILATVTFIAIRYWSRPAEFMQSGKTATYPVAPDFSVNDLSGQTLALSRYRGQVVLLNFWATWCTPCRSEIPRFVDLQNKYGRQGLQILGISLDDDPRPVPGFYQQSKMNYPVAIGDAKLAEQYGGVLGLPVSFVIGRDGRIYAKHVGETDISLIEREIKSLL
jgi:cytochrome c biogenesis protein CcmG/thiol:disulfide interchange protein DsbE